MESLSALPCSSASIGPASQLLGLLIQTLFAEQCSILPDWPPDYGDAALKEELPEYDFIVVGAGAAGSVVANRLSENKNWNILVLEAGPNPSMESEMPGLVTAAFETNNWGYFAELSPYEAISQENGTILLCGKMLGGSSAMSHGVYVRGIPNDYNNWASLGNPLWNWDNVLRHFIKSENQMVPSFAADKRYHGVGGYLPVNKFGYKGNDQTLIENCFAEMGFKQLQDINADQHVGYVTLEGMISNGEEVSSAQAFLLPIRNRTNLNIIRNARVTTLNYNDDGSVTGVNYILNGQTKLSAKAKKEVILSGGTLNSPLILMNSGIGPAEELDKFDINVVKDLPVGHNLQDHIIIPILLTFKKQIIPSATTPYLAENYFNYLMNRKGDVSNIGINDLDLFFNTDSSLKHPNFIYDMVSYGRNTSQLFDLLIAFGYNAAVRESMVQFNQQGDSVIIVVTYLEPKSRAILELRSNNPTDKPIVHTNYLTVKDDVQKILEAIRILQNIKKSKTFLQNGGEISKVQLDDCDSLPDDSDAYWECYIRHLTFSAYHYVGTDRMGPAADPRTVVDQRLKVHGVRRLRVIDASIMPQIPHGNTNAPTIMIGEMGADFVKEDWGFF